jgi:nickel/cobalt exporter
MYFRAGRSPRRLTVMTAVLYGASSGALHAVSGPDHVLSLGPVAIAHGRGSWRIGLAWGTGHALGTLLLSVPLLCLSQLSHAGWLARHGDRLSALALLVTALVSLTAAWRKQPAAGEQQVGRSAVFIGFVHGATGAGSLLLLLPVLGTGSLAHGLLYLAAFSVGSTLAMAGLTALIARAGQRLERATVGKLRTLMGGLSVVLALVLWLRA